MFSLFGVSLSYKCVQSVPGLVVIIQVCSVCSVSCCYHTSVFSLFRVLLLSYKCVQSVPCLVVIIQV